MVQLLPALDATVLSAHSYLLHLALDRAVHRVEALFLRGLLNQRFCSRGVRTTRVVGPRGRRH